MDSKKKKHDENISKTKTTSSSENKGEYIKLPIAKLVLIKVM